jgi:2-iminobutanoate/2-iminopropanoate deaminase
MSGFIKTFNSTLGPKAIGPYSTAKIFNGVMYVSGQVGINPQTGELVSDDVEDQTRQAMENLKTILAETKCSFNHVLKCTLFLKVILLYIHRL